MLIPPLIFARNAGGLDFVLVPARSPQVPVGFASPAIPASREWAQELRGSTLNILVLAAHPGEPRSQLRRFSGELPVSSAASLCFHPPCFLVRSI
jgi:hypothetical protein